MAVGFQSIREELIALWDDTGRVDLSLVIHCPLSWARGPNDPPVVDLTGKETLGMVHLPMDAEEECFSLSAGFITVSRTEQSAPLIARMKSLFGRAGANLPTPFCNRLLGYCQSVNDPVGWWVALLLLLHQKRCISDTGIPNEKVWFREPIHRSILAIEDCRLATDSPEIPRDLLAPIGQKADLYPQLRFCWQRAFPEVTASQDAIMGWLMSFHGMSWTEAGKLPDSKVIELLKKEIDQSSEGTEPTAVSDETDEQTEDFERCKDFKSNDGKWITQNYCLSRFGFTRSSLSRWATDECPYLEDKRRIRRAKFPPDQPNWCYHRIDCETISDAINPVE